MHTRRAVKIIRDANVTDTQPDTARQQEPRYAASLGCMARKKLYRSGRIHLQFIATDLSL